VTDESSDADERHIRGPGRYQASSVGIERWNDFDRRALPSEDTSTAQIVAMLGWFSEASTLASRSRQPFLDVAKRRRQYLDRYFTIQLRVFGPIHFAMPPLPSGPTIPQLLKRVPGAALLWGYALLA